MKPAVGLFAKPPVPGSVKTRLTPPLSAEQSAALYTAFLEDLAATLAGEPRWDWFVYSTDPEGQQESWPSRSPQPTAWRAQKGDDLGGRIETALTELLTDRPGAVLLGSDHPTVSRETLIDAVDRLAISDTVLGPTVDGGYYLVGMRSAPPPGLFSGISWSTDQVLVETLDRMGEAGLKPTLLPPWYDVDTVKDLRFLDVHLKGLHLADPEQDLCPATREVLSGINLK